jgi:hypothetical protein
LFYGYEIGQCYDSDVTIQGQRTQSTVSDICFNNNIFWGNDMASFEMAAELVPSGFERDLFPPILGGPVPLICSGGRFETTASKVSK